ncbi:ABC transporter ATP-binding protein [Streptomyces bobili]|uniref:ABC transporter ATP-binding protein n=1 Tax=Streptomyces bobili TaxID=67280 RepID=UPI0036597F29
MTTPILSARSLSVGYAGVPVVHDIDLDVMPGEVVTVLGANASGKTTTLLGLAGDLPLLGGEAEFDGAPLSTLFRNARRGLGLLTDDRSVFRDLTVMENLRLGAGSPERALEAFPPLRRLTDRRAGLLSGGEQQMLGLGRIIAARPRLLLADELSLGLAPTVVKDLLQAVRRLADDGAGVVLVEQHVHLVLEIADRAVVLQRGRIAFTAEADELRNNRERLVQAYLHSSSVPAHDTLAAG